MNNRTQGEMMYLRDPILESATAIKTARPRPNTLSLKLNNARTQRGIVLPLMAVSLVTLMGFMGLALDVGYVYMVRNELQDAADAAALAGAGQLFSGSSSTPDFTGASTKASSAISLLNNKAANAALVTGTISTGYWNLTGSPTGLHATATPPNDFPAVKVQISKSGTNGAVNTFFSKALGINTFNPSATAVAVVTGPGKGNLFPMVLSQCLFDQYYGSNGPVLAPDADYQPKQDDIKQTNGEPYVFAMDSDYPIELSKSKSKNCTPGKWTSYKSSSSDTATISKMINGSQLNSMAIDDDFSTKNVTADRKSLSKAAAANCSSETCRYVLVSVVADSAMESGSSGSTTPIKDLACLNIIGKESSGKYIKAQLVAADNSNCKFTASSGHGPISYGAVQPPRLVNYWGNTY